MLTGMCGINEFHVVDFTIPQRNFDSQYFVDNIMVSLVEKVFPKGRNPHARRRYLHVNNCRVHFSKITEQCIAQNHISHIPQLSYSPSLVPSDFGLFGHLRNALTGRTFDATEELWDSIISFLEEVQPFELQIVFSHWVETVR
jgi:hypothetical protein